MSPVAPAAAAAEVKCHSRYRRDDRYCSRVGREPSRRDSGSRGPGHCSRICAKPARTCLALPICPTLCDGGPPAAFAAAVLSPPLPLLLRGSCCTSRSRCWCWLTYTHWPATDDAAEHAPANFLQRQVPEALCRSLDDDALPVLAPAPRLLGIRFCGTEDWWLVVAAVAPSLQAQAAPTRLKVIMMLQARTRK